MIINILLLLIVLFVFLIDILWMFGCELSLEDLEDLDLDISAFMPDIIYDDAEMKIKSLEEENKALRKQLADKG